MVYLALITEYSVISISMELVYGKDRRRIDGGGLIQTPYGRIWLCYFISLDIILCFTFLLNPLTPNKFKMINYKLEMILTLF